VDADLADAVTRGDAGGSHDAAAGRALRRRREEAVSPKQTVVETAVLVTSFYGAEI
jgi:hypothetical protein